MPEALPRENPEGVHGKILEEIPGNISEGIPKGNPKEVPAGLRNL